MKRLLTALCLVLLPDLLACDARFTLFSPAEVQDTLDVTVFVSLDGAPTDGAWVTVKLLDHEICAFQDCGPDVAFAKKMGGGRYRVERAVTWEGCGRLEVWVSLAVSYREGAEKLSSSSDRSGCGPHTVSVDFSSESAAP